MDIYPQDLGTERQIAMLRQRISPASMTRGAEEALPAQIGPLGRWWLGGAGLQGRPARAGLAALKSGGSSGGSAAFIALTGVCSLLVAVQLGGTGHPLGALASVLFGAAISGLHLTAPRGRLREAAWSPLTGDEVETLVGAAPAPLERSYLNLVETARRLAVGPDAASGVRQALRALGDALDQLPPGVAVPDAGALRQAAARVQAQADAEQDPIVAASLQRQAQAQRRSADTASCSALLMRRTTALRDELSAQIESLRLGLTGLQTYAGDPAGLTSLAEQVSLIAQEADALAQARAELDAALTSTPGEALGRIEDEAEGSVAALHA